MSRIAFGPWTPDQPDLGLARLEEALNCLPRVQGYEAMPDLQAFGSSVTAAAVIAGYSTRDIGGNGFTFAGTADSLYKQSATGAWDNVGRTISYNAATSWRFATFGNTVLAQNGVDTQQVFALGTSTRFRDQSASASAPVATHIAVVRDFVFAGRISSFFNRVAWCQINNPLRWGRSQQNQSDLQDLPGEGGNVVGITGGDFATILTDRSVWRGSYIGAPLIFRFDELAPNTGCIAAGSVARYQGTTFFLSGSGFMAFDGQAAAPIGNEQIDDWFFEHADAGYYGAMSAAIDPDRKLYVVSFTSTGSAGGKPDRLLVYNFERGRWTNATQALDVLFSGIARGAFTLEQLDSFGTLDALAYSLDSDQWGGSKQNVLAGFTTDHVLATFDAATRKTARLITGEAQIVPEHRALVREIRPLIEGAAATAIEARVGKRDRLIDSVTYGAANALNSLGLCPVRANARYHRFRFDISGGFDHAIGFDVRFSKEGRR
jgi:hypothetical protein